MGRLTLQSRGMRGRAGRMHAIAMVLLVVPFWGPHAMSAQGTAPPRPGELSPLSPVEVLARVQGRNERRAGALHSYISHRVMTLSYKGILANRQASETVDMVFTAPATKRFTVAASTGSPLLRDSVFQRAMDSEQEAAARGDVSLAPANYEARFVGEEHLPQGDCYVLEVWPRVRSKFAFQGRVWVQTPDFAVVRLDAHPVQAPSFWVSNGQFRTEYGKVGDFWFPARTVSTSHVRLGGEATLTIDYGPYRILSAQSLGAPGTATP